MKTSKMIIAAFAAIAMVSCSNNAGEGKEVSALSDSIQVEKPVNPKSLLPSKAQKDSVSYFLGVNYGSMLKNYNFGDDLNYSLMIKGMKDFLAAKGDPRDSTFAKQFKMDPNTMNMVINDFLGKRHEYTLAVNAEKERKFLAENAAKEGVQVSESGLQYIIEEAGSELKPGPQDTVYVRNDGRHTVCWRLLHSQNGIPQYYTNRRYVSILLPTVKPDTIHLSIQTYDGIVHKTFIVKK